MTVYRILAAIVAALLYYLAFPDRFNECGFWVFGWIFAVPLFYAFDKTSLKLRFLLALLFGVISFSLTLNWSFGLSKAGGALFIAVLSMQPVIFALFYRRSPAGLLYVPCLWTASEYLRSLVMDGFTWNPGYTQSFNSYVIQAADIAGSYGLTFLLITFAYSVYCLIKDKALLYAAPVIGIPAAFFVYGHFALSDINISGPEVKAGLIQGNVDQGKPWDDEFAAEVLDKYAALSGQAASERPDLIVWPETSMPGDYYEDPALREKISQLVSKAGCQFVIGAPALEKGRLYNSALFISERGEVSGAYRKIHLLPFSEYAFREYPFVYRTLGILRCKRGEFSPGSEPVVFSLDRRSGVKFGVTLCSEDFYSGLTRELVDKGAGFVINMNNNASLGETTAPYLYLEASIMRAVENRRPVAQCSNAGISCFVSKRGQITACLEKNRKKLFIDGVTTHGLVPERARSFYTKYGSIFPVVCLLFAVILKAVHSRKEKR